MSAYQKLLDFNRANPETKEVYKKMQQWHLAEKPEHGIFCYTDALFKLSPRLARFELYGKMYPTVPLEIMNEDKVGLLTYYWSLAVFGAWRNTLGIYRIDADIFSQMLEAEIPLDTPTAIFGRLPDWCVYVEFPKNAFFIDTDNSRVAVNGFWAYADEQAVFTSYKHVLSIALDTDGKSDTQFDTMQPLHLLINDNLTIEQSVKQLKIAAPKKRDAEAAERLRLSNVNLMTSMLSVLLWLCADEPDITNIHGEPLSAEQMRLPKYTRHKKTGAFVPPNQPKVYDIGKRLGGEVRQFNERNSSEGSQPSSRKRPHIRRGHWHGVWKGTGQDKHFDLYWQPAIFVNAGA